MGKRLVVLFVVVVLSIMMEGKAMGSIVEDFLFSNKKYAKNIKTEAYLMKEEELPALFSNPDNYEIKQLPYKDLDRKTVYLVIRIRDNGDLHATGLLKCKNYGRIIRVSIPLVRFKKWSYYVISLAGAGFPNDNSIPKIDVEWEKLCTK